MSHFAAVLDANVLYSYPLTSVLLELAEARLYRPIWSKDIHEEWIRAVTRSRPDIAPEKLERRRAAMDQALPDACVSGYQRLVPAIELPDPDDRHVVAAAIRAKSSSHSTKRSSRQQIFKSCDDIRRVHFSLGAPIAARDRCCPA